MMDFLFFNMDMSSETNIQIYDEKDIENLYSNCDLNQLVDPKNIEKLKNEYSNVYGLMKFLKTDSIAGILNSSIPWRKRIFGNNIMPSPKMKSFTRFLYEALKERMVVLLIFAAIVTVTVGIYQTLRGETNAWLEGAAILIAIAIIAGVNSINDYRKQARFRMLSDTSKSLKTVKLVRNGETIQVPTTELLVGDIMFLSMGDVLPCDGVLVEGHYIKTDESSLTGESDQIIKSIQPTTENDFYDPFLLSGSTIVDGSGKMVIIAVGSNSIQGRTMINLQSSTIENPQTPLQNKLNKLAKKLATIGLVAASILLVVLIVIFVIKGIPGGLLHGLISILLVGISIIVMAIPEGLPLAVTLSLAYATIHMLKDNNLVRHLSSCETMGGATTICSDKTGTLTVNKMKVVRLFLFEKVFTREEINNDILIHSVIKTSTEEFNRLAENIMLNSEAYEANVNNRLQFIGSKTDVALLEWIKTIDKKYDYKRVRSETDIIEFIPFSSERKRMTTFIKSNERIIEYTKGASEIILGLSKYYIDRFGEQHEITDEFSSTINEIIEEFASESLRTICCAYQYHNEVNHNLNEPSTSNYILSSLFGIEDPLRDNATQSVNDCKRAGIVVRMVTGDNILTAKNIAKQCGIITSEDDIIMEGSQFRELSLTGMDNIVPKLRVLARSSPNDKYVLVDTLMRLGETVAVTGDGANDASALKKSHVGFSMGVNGSEIAKESSDIILLDDNFGSLVKAIAWGRSIYMGIQKFIMFQLAVNISAVTVTAITALESSIVNGTPSPGLTTLQILMINLIADSLAALALSTDKPSSALLDNKPRRQTDHIITGDMWRMIIGQSIYLTVVGLFIYYLGPNWWSLELRGTMVFSTFTFIVLFNELNCRSVDRDFNIFRGITKNKFFIPLFSLGLLTMYPIVVYCGIIFDTKPLEPWWLWIVCILLGLGSLLVGFIVRLIDRLFPL